MNHLKEGNGKESSTRWIFVIGMLFSMVVPTGLTLLLGWSYEAFIAVFLSTSGTYIGLKLGQKPMEQKTTGTFKNE
jgi:glycopeptide antibiotics resistance protein